MKFKKGDSIIITSGKDRGAKGKIEKVFPKLKKVLIPGVNVCKKHVKSQGEGKPGGIVDIAKPISVAKIAFLCPSCHQKTRLGWVLAKAGRERICRKCKAKITK